MLHLLLYFSCYLVEEAAKNLKFEQDGATDIFVDNKSTIALGKNLIFHERSMHIDIK